MARIIEFGKIVLASGEYWNDVYAGYDSDDDNTDFRPDPREIVVEEHEIKIYFNYIVGNPQTLTFHSNNGFTRQRLIDIICEQYQKIYETEESRRAWYADFTDLDELYFNSIQQSDFMNGAWIIHD